MRIAWIAVLGVAVSLGFCGCFGRFNEFKTKLQTTKVESIPVAQVADGDYEGIYDLQFVSAKVLVHVHSGRITGIDLLEHKHGPRYSGKKVIGRIIEKQSLAVDAVSGATGSSTVIRKAVEIALKKGVAAADPVAAESVATRLMEER